MTIEQRPKEPTSMTWYRSTLTRAQLAAGEAELRKEAFAKAFAAARAPRVMALFRMQRDDGGLDLYCTPVCAEHAMELLKRWAAVPCERPSPRNLEFLVGLNEITYYLP
jgi:hypothetical protein